jgi:hypothetical protein
MTREIYPDEISDVAMERVMALGAVNPSTQCHSKTAKFAGG